MTPDDNDVICTTESELGPTPTSWPEWVRLHGKLVREVRQAREAFQTIFEASLARVAERDEARAALARYENPPGWSPAFGAFPPRDAVRTIATVLLEASGTPNPTADELEAAEEIARAVEAALKDA